MLAEAPDAGASLVVSIHDSSFIGNYVRVVHGWFTGGGLHSSGCLQRLLGLQNCALLILLILADGAAWWSTK